MEQIKYDIFISCKSEDYKYGRNVYDFLQRKGIKAFWADKELRKLGIANYGKAIDEALEQSKHLVVVTSSVSNVEEATSPYVYYEWHTFLEKIICGKKRGNIMTIVSQMEMVSKLPNALRHHHVFSINDYERVTNYLMQPSKENINNDLIVQKEDNNYFWEKTKKDKIIEEPKPIFISYKREDSDIVFPIRERIEHNTGIKCWIDLEGIESDAQFAKVIIKAINQAKVFLFMYSHSHAEIEDYGNDWTIRELNFAQKKKKRIVFINIDGSDLTDWFEIIFGTKQQIDASSEILMNNLYSDLKKWFDIDASSESSQRTQNENTSILNMGNDTFEDSIELQLAWMEYNDGNYREALRSFLKEAKKGSAHALNAIGIYYFEGKGCSKNYQQAMSFFQKAADMGYASAMRNLGDCYRWGHGVKQDMKKSIYWYKKAAEKKNLKAIFSLAQCYQDLDTTVSNQYYLEAAHMGHEEAIKYVISHGLAKHEDNIIWKHFDSLYASDKRNDYRCLLTFKHKDCVESAIFSPDGKHIASASDDNTLHIWNAENGETIARLKGHSDSVICVSYNSDGTRIVSASDDETIRLWDTSSGVCLKVLNGHEDSIWSVSFSPDGKYIVSASVDKTVRIWDVATGICIKTMKGHSQDVHYASFSPNGQYVVSASEDGTIRIWNHKDGTCFRTLKGHLDGVWYAQFSQDGRYVLSASADKTIRIWDVNNYKCIKVLEGHRNDVNSASFSPDGKLIVSASDDETIRIWDIVTNNCLVVIEGHSDFVNSAFFSPDGKRIVSASDDCSIKVWEYSNNE